MNGSIGSVIPALLVLSAALLWWHSSVNALDRARSIARAFCQRQDWQFLDQTVSITSLRPRRAETGWILMRAYRFEFSPDGGSRCRGGVMLNGRRPVRIWADAPEGRLIEDGAPR